MNIIDLFSGCGGMSLGFELAGFNPVLAIEKDKWAAETYKLNHPLANMIAEDIREIDLQNEKMPNGESCFGIIGGPPCQGFSLSGPRDRRDPRNSLFMDYMRFAEHYRPSFFVMENVPGILSAKTGNGEFVKDVISREAREKGYRVASILRRPAIMAFRRRVSESFSSESGAIIPLIKTFSFLRLNADCL